MKLTNWIFNSVLFQIHHNTSVKNSNVRYLRKSRFILVSVKNSCVLDESLFCSKTEASKNVEVPTSTSGIRIFKWKCDCTTWSYSFAISFLFAYWIFARKTYRIRRIFVHRRSFLLQYALTILLTKTLNKENDCIRFHFSAIKIHFVNFIWIPISSIYHILLSSFLRFANAFHILFWKLLYF